MAAVGADVRGGYRYPPAEGARPAHPSLRFAPEISQRWVYGALLAHIVGFMIFWPRVFLVVDEERYVSQAIAFARGGTRVPGAEILYPPTGLQVISNYPPGTSLLQTPLVWIGGWRAAALLSVAALIVTTLVTMRLLRDSKMHPAFALLIPGFFGAAFFARLGMSDVPGAAIVALSLYLLWRSDGRGSGTSFLAGTCVGLSTLFREPLLLLLAPFIAGAFTRRRAVAWALAAGLIAGVAVRLGASALLFDSAFYVRDSGYDFAVHNVAHTIPAYAFALLVLFPMGALLPFLYHGPRRAEVIAAVTLYTLLFLLYGYDPIRENGLAKGLILASRFIIPLLPVLTLMAANVWPRWHAWFVARAALPATTFTRIGAVLAIVTAFLVHPLAQRQERVPLSIVRGIYSQTTTDVPVITNSNATLKYFSPAYGPRKLILRYGLTADSTASFVKRFGRLSIVLLDRNDSEAHRGEEMENERYLADVRRSCSLRPTRDEWLGGWAHLRVFELAACG